MKFYCVETWLDLYIKGKTYDAYITHAQDDGFKIYMVETEDSGYQTVSNPLFMNRFFMDVTILRKLKLKKIQNEILLHKNI